MKNLKHKFNLDFLGQGAQDILKKGGSFLVFRAAGLLAGYAFTYLVAQHYGASANGLVALCFSIFVFVAMLGRLGVDTNLVKFYAVAGHVKSNPGVFYRVVTKSFFFSALLAVLLFLFKDFLAETVFQKPQLTPFLKWIIPCIPLWVLVGHFSGFLRAIGRNNWYAFLNNSGRFFFTTILLVVFLWISNDPTDAMKAHFYAILALTFIGFLKCFSVLKVIRFSTNTNSWQFMKEAFPMMLSSTILVLLGWMDTFILGIFETDEAVGIYHVSLKIATLTSFALEAINSVLAPKIAAAYHEEKKSAYKQLIRFSTNLNFFITLFLVAGILIFNKDLLRIFEEEFVAGSTVLIVLCLGQLVNSLSGSVGIIMQMTGHQEKFQKIVLIALLINLTLNLILTPIYGVLGAAIATIVSISFWNISGAVYLKRKVNIQTYVSFSKK
ncbi:MAG: flippase [Bacteroidota bacterium]